MYKTREEIEAMVRQDLSRLCKHCGQTEGKHSHDDFCPLADDAPRHSARRKLNLFSCSISGK